MYKNGLLRQAVLMVIIAFSCFYGSADVTVKVKSYEAPYLYAFDNSDNRLLEAWPGTLYTEKDADGYWTMTVPGVSTLNVIFNDGGDASHNNVKQTADIKNVSGVNGVARFFYNGATRLSTPMPDLSGATEGCIYFNYPPDWGNYTPHIHFLNSSDGQLGAQGWPGYEMTYVGQDGAGFKVYKYDTSSWTGISKLIFNNNGNGKQTGNLVYVYNGYYNTDGSQSLVHALTSANGYTDAAFRSAVATQLCISDGALFVPGDVTYLDVSNSSISSIAGVGNMVNLQTLLAAGNSLSTADLGSNHSLAVLNLSGNSSLRGFSSSYSSSSNYINLASGVPLKDLNLANCNIGYFQAINGAYSVNSLKRLNLAGNSAMSGWSNGIGAQTKLKYLNVSGNAYGSNGLTLTNLTQLDTLIADSNPNLGNISTLSSAAGLRYVSLKNCGLTNSIGFGSNPALEYIDISNNSGTAKNFTLSNNQNLKVFKASNAAIKQNGLTWNQASLALDTLIVSGNTAMQYLNSLQYASNLKYLDMSGGDLYLDNMSTFTGANFPMLDYIDFSSDRISAARTISGFTALKTLKMGGNTSMPSLTVSNCPALEALDLTGNTSQTSLALTNQGYSATSDLPSLTLTNTGSLNMLDLSDNSFTAVPDLGVNSSKFIYLKLRNNALPAVYTFTGNTTLAGLDLTGNTALTDLAITNTNLSGIMLGGLTALKTLDLSGNSNITTTAGNNTDANLTSGVGRVYLSESTALEEINISNCNIRNASSYNNFDVSHCTSLTKIVANGNSGTRMTHLQASDLPASVEEIYLSGCAKLVLSTQLTALNSHKSTLRVLDVSNCAIATVPSGGITGYSALQTLKIGENPGITSLSVTGNAALSSLDVKNNSGMTTLTASGNALSSIDITGCSALTTLDLSSNLFTSMPDLTGSSVSWLDMSSNSITGIPANTAGANPLVTLKMNNSSVSDIANASTYPNLRYLYVQDNNFGATYTLNANSQLKGLAISNKTGNTALTEFTATANTALESLDLSGNSSLATLNLHGNTALTQTTATAGAIETSEGLYIKGLASLQTLDISNSSFNLIGQSNSLLGTGIKTLKASHNAFTTFTNSNYNLGSSSNVNYRPASYVSGRSSLEDLTALEYLDVSYNQIADSVHLRRNTALKYLDVSHNQILGELATSQADVEAMIQKKVMAAAKYSTRNPINGNRKDVGISLAYSNNLRDARKKTDVDGTYRYYDFRPCDLRDTTGIFHLDLHTNVNLEYLDFSYTNIHNTAAGYIYMCPSWDRTGNWNDYVTSGSPSAANGPTKHHFVWLQRCSKLKVLKADGNSMQSLGLNCYPDLDTVSCAGMYGDCMFMSDQRGPGYGNKGFPNGMTVYDHSVVSLTSEGIEKEDVYYHGTDGTAYNGATAVPVAYRYPNKIRYANFSNGGFYNINPTYGVSLTKLDVSGNPLQGGGYTGTPLNVTTCPDLVELDASDCSQLLQIDAYGLNDLETLNVTGDTMLEILRAYDDPELYGGAADFITGLDDCTALKELWVSNDNISNPLDLSSFAALETLKVYDNAALNELDVTDNLNLKHLDAARCKLNELDLSSNTALEYLDVSNTAVPSSVSDNGKNKLSDIVINSSAIREVHAANNNLYSLKGLSGRTALTQVDVPHNHINGLDLTGCTSLTAANVIDNDNGRTIQAEYNVVTPRGSSTSYDVYFFQTDEDAATAANQTFLGNRTSADVLKGEPRDALEDEGFDIAKVTAWTSNADIFHGTKGSSSVRRKNEAFDPDDAADILNPASVNGDVVLLDASNPTAEYSYNNGVGTSTYYLAWTAPATPTTVEDIIPEGLAVRGGESSIIVSTSSDIQVQVVDLNGRVIRNETLAAGNHVLEGFEPGIYFVAGEKVKVW